MATATPLKEVRASILKSLLDEPQTRQQLVAEKYDLDCLKRDGFITTGGLAKNEGTGGRKAVLYKLTAKGKRRASK